MPQLKTAVSFDLESLEGSKFDQIFETFSTFFFNAPT